MCVWEVGGRLWWGGGVGVHCALCTVHCAKASCN